MRTLHQNVTCPVCHQTAELKLVVVHPLPGGDGTDGYEVRFDCPLGHRVDERTATEMWAKLQLSS